MKQLKRSINSLQHFNHADKKPFIATPSLSPLDRIEISKFPNNQTARSRRQWITGALYSAQQLHSRRALSLSLSLRMLLVSLSSLLSQSLCTCLRFALYTLIAKRSLFYLRGLRLVLPSTVSLFSLCFIVLCMFVWWTRGGKFIRVHERARAPMYIKRQ